MKTRMLLGLSSLPVLFVVLFISTAEPPPNDWLAPSNPHYAANLFRATSFLIGGFVTGMSVYTLIAAVGAEQTVMAGHPRRKLYRHVTSIALAHMMLVVTTLFFIRDRINHQLSPGTPIAFCCYFVTLYALAKMIGYQHSRLDQASSSHQVYAVVEDLTANCFKLRPVGSAEGMSMEEWLRQFPVGGLVRVSVEGVEADPPERKWFARWVREVPGHRPPG